MILINDNTFDLTSKNAVYYIRVSSKDQAKGTSLEDQKKCCREFCKQNLCTEKRKENIL